VGGHALLAVGAADPAPVGVDAVGRVWAGVVVVVVAAGVLGPCVLRFLPRVQVDDGLADGGGDSRPRISVGW
jgi:hypothetical protein